MNTRRWFFVLAATALLMVMVFQVGLARSTGDAAQASTVTNTWARTSMAPVSPAATPTFPPRPGGTWFGQVFMLNSSSGVGRTGIITFSIATPYSAEYIPQLSYTNFSRKWTSVTEVGNHIFFFHSNLDGSGATLRIGMDGSLATLRDYPSNSFPYDTNKNMKVTSTQYDTGIVLFYQFGTGFGQIGRFDYYGNYTALKSQYGYYPYWTNIVPVANGLLFFYNSSSGSAETAGIDPNTGNLTNLYFYTLSTGWTDLVMSLSQRDPSLNLSPILFYTRAQGTGVTGGVADNGAFRSLYGASLGAGWSPTALNNGLQLFYNAGSGAADTWWLLGDCTYRAVSFSSSLGTGWDIVVGTR